MTDYPHRPGSKERSTSQDAADSMARSAKIYRGRVLDCLSHHPAGLTADEIADRLGLTILSIRPRVSELNRLGLIEQAGERRANASGRMAHVWRIPSASREDAKCSPARMP